MHADVNWNADEFADQFREQGFALIDNVLNQHEVEDLREGISAIPTSEAVRQKRAVYGVRNLLEISETVRELAASERLHQFVSPLLGESAFATRAVFFDKAPDANWALGWHQDRVISVAGKIEVPGFSGWREKAGVWHVQPPLGVLTNMVAVRVHLDECDIENGPLKVLPGSHHQLLLEQEIDAWKQTVPEVVCSVSKGGLLLMRPLLLHASSKSKFPAHRRVIHLEFANQDLPGQLQWNTQIFRVE